MRSLALTLVVAAAAALAVLGGAWLASRSGDEDVPILAQDVVAARATVTPGSQLFGDRATAEVDVLLDRNFVDPATVRLDAEFRPYRVEGRPAVRRTDVGATTRLRYTYTLACLAERCAPRRARRAVRLRDARVSYVIDGIRERQVTELEWPDVGIGSRLAGTNLDQATLRADPRELPAVSYRVRPRLLAGAALGLAGLLLLAAIALVAPLVPIAALTRRLALRRARRRSALERALVEVRRADADGDRDEVRPALQRLASELRFAERPELARDARKLAWSQRGPAPERVGELSDEVEQVIAGRR